MYLYGTGTLRKNKKLIFKNLNILVISKNLKKDGQLKLSRVYRYRYGTSSTLDINNNVNNQTIPVTGNDTDMLM
jgi:hypothetical protein